MKALPVILLIVGIVIGVTAGALFARTQARMAVLAGSYSDDYVPARREIEIAVEKLHRGDTNILEQLANIDARLSKAQQWSKRFLGDKDKNEKQACLRVSDGNVELSCMDRPQIRWAGLAVAILFVAGLIVGFSSFIRTAQRGVSLGIVRVNDTSHPPRFEVDVTNHTSHALLQSLQLEKFEQNQWRTVPTLTQVMKRTMTNKYSGFISGGEVRRVQLTLKDSWSPDLEGGPRRWRIRALNFYNPRFDSHWRAKLFLMTKSAVPRLAKSIAPEVPLTNSFSPELNIEVPVENR